MAKEFIVAIEIGSSKITGIAGKKNLDGSLSVLAVVQEPATECIRKGVIFNIDKTMTALMSIRDRMERQLHTKIRQVYVGVSGRSIVGVKNTILREFPSETKITTEMTNEMMDSNSSGTDYGDRKILEAITLQYTVDGRPITDPVGVQCTRLEGHFLNILWRKLYFDNLEECFRAAKLPIVEIVISPMALAEGVLAEAERRAGCLLVDLGADTTTVAVYYRNILRHLAVLPLGGANITKDIATLQMEDSEAEQMKLRYANAYTEETEIDTQAKYTLSDGREVDVLRFIELVESRVEEIVKNVWFQVPAEYQDMLLGGVVLTGGAAMMKNIDKVFRTITHKEKVRIATIINQTLDATQPEIKAHDARLNTALSLLAKGNTNCAGESLAAEKPSSPTDGLFASSTGDDSGSSSEGGATPAGGETTTGEDDTPTPPAPASKPERRGWFRKIAQGAKKLIDIAITDEE